MNSTTQRAEGAATAAAATVFTERFVQADGGQIRYLEAGQGDPVVVFHEGDGLSPLNNLLAQQFRVLAFEIPDLDSSPVNEQPSSLRDMARTFAWAVAAAGLDRYVLVSTSASAPMAL